MFELNNNFLSLQTVSIRQTNNCDSGTEPILDRQTLTTEGYNIKSSAEFFVFLGVMAFLYSLTMLVIYIFFKHKYDNSVYLPLVVSF